MPNGFAAAIFSICFKKSSSPSNRFRLVSTRIFGLLHVHIIVHHRLKAGRLLISVHLLQAPIVVDIELLVALGFANMWMGIFADVGVMVLAVLNAIRALRTSKN